MSDLLIGAVIGAFTGLSMVIGRAWWEVWRGRRRDAARRDAVARAMAAADRATKAAVLDAMRRGSAARQLDVRQEIDFRGAGRAEERR